MPGAIAYAPVAAKRGLPAVRTLISRAISGAHDATCAIACRAVDRVAFVSDGAVLQHVAFRSGRYAAAGCGGVAVADVVAQGHVVLAVVIRRVARYQVPVRWHSKQRPMVRLSVFPDLFDRKRGASRHRAPSDPIRVQVF